MFLSSRSADLIIGPLKSTGGQVRIPSIYRNGKFAVLLLVSLLGIVGIVCRIVLAPAKPSANEAEAHDPRNSISGDQQTTITLPRLAEPAAEGAETTLDGGSSIPVVDIGGQDAPTSSIPYQEPLADPPALGGNAILPPDFSSEYFAIPPRPPDGPELPRQVDRVALRDLIISLLASNHSRPEQAEPLSTSATLAQGPRHRQRRRTTPAKKRGMSGRK
jgi:hypothetical protein